MRDNCGGVYLGIEVMILVPGGSHAEFERTSQFMVFEHVVVFPGHAVFEGHSLFVKQVLAPIIVLQLCGDAARRNEHALVVLRSQEREIRSRPVPLRNIVEKVLGSRENIPEGIFEKQIHFVPVVASDKVKVDAFGKRMGN